MEWLYHCSYCKLNCLMMVWNIQWQWKLCFLRVLYLICMRLLTVTCFSPNKGKSLIYRVFLFLCLCPISCNLFSNNFLYNSLMQLFFMKVYRDQIKWFGIANHGLFFASSESKTTLLQLFHKPWITSMFQKTIIKFLKLTKLQQKQKPKQVLQRMLCHLVIEPAWNPRRHVMQIKQLLFA